MSQLPSIHSPQPLAPTRPLSIARGLFGAATVAATFLFGLIMSGPIAVVVDGTSFMVVIAGTAGLLMATHGPRAGAEAVRALILGPPDRDTAARATSLFLTGGLASFGLGVVWSLEGCIYILANMFDPRSAGPALGVSLLTALYGLIGGLGGIAAAIAVARRAGAQALESTTGIGAIAGVIGIAMISGPAVLGWILLWFAATTAGL